MFQGNRIFSLVHFLELFKEAAVIVKRVREFRGLGTGFHLGLSRFAFEAPEWNFNMAVFSGKS